MFKHIKDLKYKSIKSGEGKDCFVILITTYMYIVMVCLNEFFYLNIL